MSHKAGFVFFRSGRWRIAAALAGFGVLIAGVGALTLYHDVAQTDVQSDLRGPSVSKVVLDRNNRLLRAFTADDRRWRLPVALDQVAPLYIKMLTAFEDKRFGEHSGVDVLSLLRAGWQAAVNGRIVSGGSTLTMQVARLLREQPTRSVATKYRQIVDALALETLYDKSEILSLYALRAPFGGNIEGVRAASLIWFGKEPVRLTPAQAALLVALPQSPEGRRPDRNPKAAKIARDRVLRTAWKTGIIPLDAYQAALTEPVPNFRRQMPMLAAHKAREALGRMPGVQEHQLTIDRELQIRLEKMAQSQAAKLAQSVSLAILVADHQSGEVLAAVGSPDLTDDSRRGHIDMTSATRSPGSTLKPLIYGLAFEDGIAHPESFIQDRPIDVGGYKPTNFSKAFQGRVTIREALQLSLNVPAVQTLQAVGTAKFLARLRRTGARPTLPTGLPPGLAIGLGGMGLSLEELVALYAGLASRGTTTPLRIKHQAFQAGPTKRIVEETPAWYVEDILIGVPRPDGVSGKGIAFKTGTSYGYRDSWAIGFDGQHVIGVWVGRPDGSPVPGMTGIETASPILFEAFARVAEKRVPFAQPPIGALAATSNVLPAPLRHARVNRPELRIEGEAGLAITYPPNGSEVDLGLAETSSRLPLVIKTSGGKRPLRWFVNDRPVENSRIAEKLIWEPDELGYMSVTVVDHAGQADRITIRLR